MAKTNERIEPESDDLDGQASGTSGETGNESDNGSGSGTGAVDPASLIGSGNSGADEYVRDSDGSIARNKDGSLKRKRGRKAGSGTGTVAKNRQAGNNQNLKDSIDSLASMIGFVHLGLAAVSKCEELALEDAETKALAQATANVMAQFDMTPDPRITAVVGLLTTAGTIYVPRYYLINSRLKKEKVEKRPSIVVPSNTGQFDPSNYNLGG